MNKYASYSLYLQREGTSFEDFLLVFLTMILLWYGSQVHVLYYFTYVYILQSVHHTTNGVHEIKA